MYPSQQMFYNAMRRKGWNPSEDDMQAVVAIHNGVNERAWSEVGLLQCWPVSMYGCNLRWACCSITCSYI